MVARAWAAPCLSAAVFAMWLGAGTAAAQDKPKIAEPSAQGAFGLQLQDYWVYASQFQSIHPAGTWFETQDGFWRVNSGTAPIFSTQATLPAGAVITDFFCYFHDSSSTADAAAQLNVNIFDLTTGGPNFLVIDQVATSGQPGYTIPFASGLNHTVKYRDGQHRNIYRITVFLPLDANVRFRACNIRWHRSVSPPPGAATFTDVPTNSPIFAFVEALAAAGITGGCGGGNYCPDQPLTRGQMAVFLAAALGLHWPF